MPNIEINRFTLSPDGTKLLKGCDTEECHIPYGQAHKVQGYCVVVDDNMGCDYCVGHTPI